MAERNAVLRAQPARLLVVGIELFIVFIFSFASFSAESAEKPDLVG